MSIGRRFKEWLTGGLDILSAIVKSLSDDPRAWEPVIQKFEAQDRLAPPPPGVVVFTGSSSITFWSTLERDMAPLPVINRGFGGAHLRDVVYYADRIAANYHPRAVVLFAGTNDIAGSKPKTAQEVCDGYRAFVGRIHSALPETPVYYISITPAPSRRKHWPAVSEANRLIKAHTETDPRLHFIDLTNAILGPDGKPDRSLFRIDRLHPNKKGYARWTATIKPILQADLAA